MLAHVFVFIFDSCVVLHLPGYIPWSKHDLWKNFRSLVSLLALLVQYSHNPMVVCIGIYCSCVAVCGTL